MRWCVPPLYRLAAPDQESLKASLDPPLGVVEGRVRQAKPVPLGEGDRIEADPLADRHSVQVDAIGAMRHFTSL